MASLVWIADGLRSSDDRQSFLPNAGPRPEQPGEWRRLGDCHPPRHFWDSFSVRFAGTGFVNYGYSFPGMVLILPSRPQQHIQVP